MERSIYEAAAEEGSVESLLHLLHLLREDAIPLDRIMASCYPLHVASMLGHGNFVQEIINRKPELATELDSRKSSPLHLATAKGYLDIVKILVYANPEMCSVCDQDGRNPVHVAAIKGRVDILKELVQERPQAARILMNGGETILHACVRYNQLEAMKLLLETFAEDHEFVNHKNVDGDTIFHLAAAEKQTEEMKFLIRSTAVEVKALNADGLPASETLLLQTKGDDDDNKKNSEIIKLLLRRVSATLKSGKIRAILDYLARQNDEDWVRDKQNTLMIVASLIAAMAFQLGVNPPRGLWQESEDKTTPHDAGSSIFADLRPQAYTRFLSYNTISFVLSLCVIFMFVSGLPFRSRIQIWTLMFYMCVATTTTAVTYFITITAITPPHSLKKYNVKEDQISWFLLVIVVVLLHGLRFWRWMIQLNRKLSTRGQRRSSSSSSSGMSVNQNAASNLDNLNNV